ncbi:MAG: hypothetical protein AAFY83_13940 [Pseudomonadota bacterium]
MIIRLVNILILALATTVLFLITQSERAFGDSERSVLPEYAAIGGLIFAGVCVLASFKYTRLLYVPAIALGIFALVQFSFILSRILGPNGGEVPFYHAASLMVVLSGVPFLVSLLTFLQAVKKKPLE